MRLLRRNTCRSHTQRRSGAEKHDKGEMSMTAPEKIMFGYGTKQEIHDAIVSTTKYYREQMALTGPHGDPIGDTPYPEMATMSNILMLDVVINTDWDGTGVPDSPPESTAWMRATHTTKWLKHGIDLRWIDKDGVEYSWRELGFEGHLFDDATPERLTHANYQMALDKTLKSQER